MEMRRRIVVLFRCGLNLKKTKARLKDGILVSNLKTLKKFVDLRKYIVS